MAKVSKSKRKKLGITKNNQPAKKTIKKYYNPTELLNKGYIRHDRTKEVKAPLKEPVIDILKKSSLIEHFGVAFNEVSAYFGKSKSLKEMMLVAFTNKKHYDKSINGVDVRKLSDDELYDLMMNTIVEDMVTRNRKRDIFDEDSPFGWFRNPVTYEMKNGLTFKYDDYGFEIECALRDLSLFDLSDVSDLKINNGNINGFSFPYHNFFKKDFKEHNLDIEPLSFSDLRFILGKYKTRVFRTNEKMVKKWFHDEVIEKHRSFIAPFERIKQFCNRRVVKMGRTTDEKYYDEYFKRFKTEISMCLTGTDLESSMLLSSNYSYLYQGLAQYEIVNEDGTPDTTKFPTHKMKPYVRKVRRFLQETGDYELFKYAFMDRDEAVKHILKANMEIMYDPEMETYAEIIGAKITLEDIFNYFEGVEELFRLNVADVYKIKYEYKGYEFISDEMRERIEISKKNYRTSKKYERRLSEKNHNRDDFDFKKDYIVSYKGYKLYFRHLMMFWDMSYATSDLKVKSFDYKTLNTNYGIQKKTLNHFIELGFLNYSDELDENGEKKYEFNLNDYTLFIIVERALKSNPYIRRLIRMNKDEIIALYEARNCNKFSSYLKVEIQKLDDLSSYGLKKKVKFRENKL